MQALARPRSQVPVLAASGLLVMVLWNSWVVWPLKILTVFLHETSHGLAAVLTGGGVDRLLIESNEGGLAFTHGGSRFLILNAGYLGSLLWGAGLILASSYSRYDRALTGALGAFLGGVTLWYVRSPFGFVFGLLTAGALVWSGRRMSDAFNDMALKIIGVTSCSYAVLDVWSDVVVRSCRSDASMLADMTGVPRLVWAGLWIGLSFATLWGTLRRAALARA